MNDVVTVEFAVPLNNLKKGGIGTALRMTGTIVIWINTADGDWFLVDDEDSYPGYMGYTWQRVRIEGTFPLNYDLMVLAYAQTCSDIEQINYVGPTKGDITI